MRLHQLFLLSAAFVTACSSCGHEPARVHKPSEQQARRDSIENERIQGHRQFLKEERAHIEAYAQAMQWQLQPTGTGLYIQVFSTGKGEKAQVGNRVKVQWYPMLLDGTLLYDGESTQALQWRVEKEEAVAMGLHEVVQQMRAGDSARVVLPSHLAYGIAGISEQVPMRSALAGRILLIEVQP